MSVDETEITAAAWLGREDRGLSAEEQDALDLWLEQSILHKVAYLRLKAAWQRADRLAALKSPAPAAREQSGSRPLVSRCCWAPAPISPATHRPDRITRRTSAGCRRSAWRTAPKWN